jgi:hypothetical protein
LLIGQSLLNCGVHLQMKSRLCKNIYCFVYEDDIKIKNNYFATI